MSQKNQNSVRHHTSGELLARNTIWNLLASLSPVIAGAISVPLLIQAIGPERFGVLSLAWIVLGYAGLLDLGLGRALTKLASEKLGSSEESQIVPIAWASLVILLLLGVFGTLVIGLISPWLVHRALRVPAGLQTETVHGFYVLAASIPITMVTSALRGLLEALQRFRVLTLIRIPLTIFSFGGPFLVLPFSHSLVAIFMVLMAGRFLGCVAHLVACSRALPGFGRSVVLDFRLMATLFKFGTWMTATNLLGPAVIYADRFIIGSLLSLTAVAFYTAPFDMLTRVWLVPSAFIGVLFPAFAATYRHDVTRTRTLLVRGMKFIFVAVFPIILTVVTFSPEILRIWLGKAFEQNSAHALQLLAIGIFLNCLAQVPFTFIQSAGRPDVTAKMALLEFPFYWVSIWLLTTRFGINGTALAWAVRSACELAFLVFYAVRLIPQTAIFSLGAVASTAGGLVILGFGAVVRGGWNKSYFFTLTLIGFLVTCWFWAFDSSERFFLFESLARRSAWRADV